MKFSWKISEGGNSGVFYHVVEGPAYKAPYYTGPEYQVIDQLGFAQPLEDWQSLAADYAMYVPDFEGVVKPAGEWNVSKIRERKNKEEYPDEFVCAYQMILIFVVDANFAFSFD